MKKKNLMEGENSSVIRAVAHECTGMDIEGMVCFECIRPEALFVLFSNVPFQGIEN